MKKFSCKLLAFFHILLFASCSKEDTVEIYRPPAAIIRFNNVSDFIIDSAGKNITVKAQVVADDGLSQIALVYEPWGLNKVTTSFTDPSKIDFNQSVAIPKNAALQIHSLKLQVTDKKGKTNSTEIKVGLQDLNYTTLYLTDAKSASELTGNLFGVPVAMDKLSSHTYQVTYYAKDANTSVKFIPDPASFTPVAIGVDPTNNVKLTTDGSKSKPVVLPAKGYYKIKVNTLLLTYTVEQVAAQGTAYAQVAIVGRGFYDYPDMNWQNTLPNIILMDKDATNPFLFTKTVKLGIPSGQSYTTAQFILTTNNGWTNFWRFNDAVRPTRAVFNGGSNTEIPITTIPQNFKLIFDSQTGIIQALKQ